MYTNVLLSLKWHITELSDKIRLTDYKLIHNRVLISFLIL